MAWLLINTADRAHLSVAVIPESGEIQERIAEGSRISVFSVLRELISPSEFAELQGIAVVYGPGSFSAIRSGVLIANLLSRLYHIPLYGFSKDDARDLVSLRRQLVENAVSASEYVSPVYDAEPNITVK